MSELLSDRQRSSFSLDTVPPVSRRATAALALLGLVIGGAISSTPAYGGTDYLGQSQTGLIGYANSVAVAPDGRVYVAGQSAIMRLAQDGRSVEPFLALENAHAVAVDEAGDVYVTPDSMFNQTGVMKYDSNGTELWNSRPNLFNAPDYGSLSVAKGIVWFTTWDMVYGLDAQDGTLLHSFRTTNAQEIVALPNGNVLVGHNRVTGGLTEYFPTGGQARTVPQFALKFTVAPDGTIIGSEYRPDGSMRTRVTALAPSGQLKYAYLQREAVFADYAVDGTTGVVWAVVPGGGSGSPQLVRIDPASPDAFLSGSTSSLTGGTATYDATRSVVPFGAVAKFEWDFDQDGTFELDSGQDGTVDHIFTTAGSRTVTVRVTGNEGGIATASQSTNVFLSPPPAPSAPPPSTPPSAAPAPVPAPGPVGVSINGGDQYTNDPNVQIVARWPLGYRTAIVSNDGGFVPRVEGPVSNAIAWTLDSSGPERLPKTIYVRFADGSQVSETYQDDIILDQTRPTIGEASAVAAKRVSQPDVSLRAVRKLTVRVRAADGTSGVRSMQITTSKRRPGKWMSYKRTRSYRADAAKVFVRVRDGAGNTSGWKRLRY